jgi:hypothetical protein
VSDASVLLQLIREKVAARRLASRVAGATVPTTPVAVYFGDGPGNLYQLRRWYRVLAALDAVHPVVILVSNASTYERVQAETSLTVGFAVGPQQQAVAVERRGVRVVLYVNHSAENFRMLRLAAPVHVFIGHGESDKESSVSRQLTAYDFDFVADAASIARLRGIRGYDVDAAAMIVGSPWLEVLPDAPPSWTPDSRITVLYAPTWEGDRPTMDYSSVEGFGEKLATAILADPKLRLIYRPHPWLGRVRKSVAAADARIRSAVSASDGSGFVDLGEYGWVLDAADVCVSDVSSVAHDWRSTGKPLFMVPPSSATVDPVPESAYSGATVLAAADASRIPELIATIELSKRPSVANHLRAPSAFIDAVTAALEVADRPIL